MITDFHKFGYPGGIVLVMSLLLLITASSCDSDGNSSGNNSSALVSELLAKSEPDECFCGIGAEDNGPISNSATGDCSDLTPEEPLTVCVPKRNYSYLWGITKMGRQVWLGTLQNTICQGTLGRAGGPRPNLNDEWVCEFDQSHVASTKPNPTLGDHRIPQIMVYDTKSKVLEQISVENCDGGTALLDTTVGIRQAGSLDRGDFKVVIMAGLSLFGGINMFAFDPDMKVCIAARRFPEYNEARNQMIVVDGVLYTAVGKSIDKDNPEGGGTVLRYRGDSSDPLRWEEVGKLDTIGAGITLHQGRLFVATWPNIEVILADSSIVVAPNLLNGPKPGIYMGPIIPPDGLTNAHLSDWVKVWDASDYEPNLGTAAVYNIGDLASFQGRLWWGTIHVPGVASDLHLIFFEPDVFFAECSCNNRRCFSNPVPDPDCCVVDPETASFCEREDLADENANRRTAVFRGTNFESTPEIELLYGESTLPVFNTDTGEWEEKPNASSLMPIFGKSGIDNSFNVYTWNMAVFRDQLYLATLDIGSFSDEPDNAEGADLVRFTDLDLGADPVSLDGLGNPFNFGFRTLLSDEDGKNGDDALYIGTANPFNLAPEGGWELLRLK